MILLSDQSELLQKWEVEFKKGFSKPLILLLLEKGESYPYRLVRDIKTATFDHIEIATSNVYPLLKTVRNEGLVKEIQKEQTMRKYYALTEEGNIFLKDLRSSMKAFLEKIIETL